MATFLPWVALILAFLAGAAGYGSLKTTVAVLKSEVEELKKNDRGSVAFDAKTEERMGKMVDLARSIEKVETSVTSAFSQLDKSVNQIVNTLGRLSDRVETIERRNPSNPARKVTKPNDD